MRLPPLSGRFSEGVNDGGCGRGRGVGGRGGFGGGSRTASRFGRANPVHGSNVRHDEASEARATSGGGGAEDVAHGVPSSARSGGGGRKMARVIAESRRRCRLFSCMVGRTIDRVMNSMKPVKYHTNRLIMSVSYLGRRVSGARDKIGHRDTLPPLDFRSRRGSQRGGETSVEPKYASIHLAGLSAARGGGVREEASDDTSSFDSDDDDDDDDGGGSLHVAGTMWNSKSQLSVACEHPDDDNNNNNHQFDGSNYSFHTEPLQLRSGLDSAILGGCGSEEPLGQKELHVARVTAHDLPVKDLKKPSLASLCASTDNMQSGHFGRNAGFFSFAPTSAPPLSPMPPPVAPGAKSHFRFQQFLSMRNDEDAANATGTFDNEANIDASSTRMQSDWLKEKADGDHQRERARETAGIVLHAAPISATRANSPVWELLEQMDSASDV